MNNLQTNYIPQSYWPTIAEKLHVKLQSEVITTSRFSVNEDRRESQGSEDSCKSMQEDAVHHVDSLVRKNPALYKIAKDNCGNEDSEDAAMSCFRTALKRVAPDKFRSLDLAVVKYMKEKYPPASYNACAPSR
jgi:hypothetical protein